MVVTVVPIRESDLSAVEDYFRTEWPRDNYVPGYWTRAVDPPWRAKAPDYGFMLVDQDAIVGAYLILYADRLIRGRPHRIANLCIWHVNPDYRLHSLKLMRAVLAIPNVHLVDVTPRKHVVAIDLRFGFQRLDTTLAIMPNLPYPTVPGRGYVSSSPEVISTVLQGDDLEIYRDHADTAQVRHAVLVSGDRVRHVMVSKHRLRNIRGFGTIRYVSDRELFHRMARRFARHMLLRHRIAFTLAELRVVGQAPRPSKVVWMESNRKLFRSDTLSAEDIDYLYTEDTWRITGREENEGVGGYAQPVAPPRLEHG